MLLGDTLIHLHLVQCLDHVSYLYLFQHLAFLSNENTQDPFLWLLEMYIYIILTDGRLTVQ